MSIYNIGNIIKELRKKKNFSQKQLAEGICSIEYISKIENNKKNPSTEIASKLLAKLGADSDMFLSHLNFMDNKAYQTHCFELEALISKSNFKKARKYIKELEKNYPFYASGEPKQYLMTKSSHILANLDKNFEGAYELALNAILLTKPDFTIDSMPEYEFYSINELWAMLYMAAALFWDDNDHQRNIHLDFTIRLGRTVFSHLEKGYLQPSLVGTLYTCTSFYLSKFLCANGDYKEASVIADKGIAFVTSHYNQIIELLGKIFCNKTFCMYFQDDLDAAKRLSTIGGVLIKLASNQPTIERYLNKSFEETSKYWKYPDKHN